MAGTIPAHPGFLDVEQELGTQRNHPAPRDTYRTQEVDQRGKDTSVRRLQ